MAIIDCAIWKPKDNMFVFAYRIPQTNLSTHTQLVVYESQEALFFSKGQLMGKFGPGKHTLTTENLPLLRTLYGIPFGGKNPFTAEVWIVNKLFPANLPWGVNNISIHDVDYQTFLPLCASGQYGVNVRESERFLIKMVGTKTEFNQNDMHSQAYGEFSSKVKSAVIQFMVNNQIGFKRVSGYLDQLSQFVKSSIENFWKEYGLELTKFYINDITIDKSTPEGVKLSQALASQASMSITGHSWQQEQMMGIANNAVNQIGGASGSGGLLAGMMALNMMNGMGGMGGLGTGMMETHHHQPTFGGPSSPHSTAVGGAGGQNQPTLPAGRMVYCANCSKKHASTERFCPHCGSEYHPCPRCGSDNMPNATRCVSCGTPLQTSGSSARSTCIGCGATLSPGALFCPACGTKQAVSEGNKCPRCGTSVPATSRFCPGCGQKVR